MKETELRFVDADNKDMALYFVKYDEIPDYKKYCMLTTVDESLNVISVQFDESTKDHLEEMIKELSKMLSFIAPKHIESDGDKKENSNG